MLRILVVCTANVCRSQYARMLLFNSFATHPELGGVIVQCAGTITSKDSAICENVLRHLKTEVSDTQKSPTRPRSVSDVSLAHMNLILTAESAHRSVIARLAPEVRSKTFTFREANHFLVSDRESGRFEDLPDADFSSRFAWIVARMNASRGVLPMPLDAPRRFRFSKKSFVDGLDIPDNHGGSTRDHERTLSAVKAEIETFATELKAAL